MKKQDGYTALELLVVMICIASLAVLGFSMWAFVHFISKYW